MFFYKLAKSFPFFIKFFQRRSDLSACLLLSSISFCRIKAFSGKDMASGKFFLLCFRSVIISSTFSVCSHVSLCFCLFFFLLFQSSFASVSTETAEVEAAFRNSLFFLFSVRYNLDNYQDKVNPWSEISNSCCCFVDKITIM